MKDFKKLTTYTDETPVTAGTGSTPLSQSVEEKPLNTMKPLQQAVRKYLSMNGIDQFEVIKQMGLFPDSARFVSNHERDKEFFSRINVANERDKFIELMGIPSTPPIQTVEEAAETEDVNLLKRRLEFYRNETAKIRDYVFDDANKCGYPTQSIFEAITDKIDALKAEIAEHQARQQPLQSDEIGYPSTGVRTSCDCGNGKRKLAAGMPHGCYVCNPSQWTIKAPDSNPKPFTISIIRDLDKQVAAGDMSYSRMVEVLNEKAGYGVQQPVRKTLDRYDIDFGGNVMAGIEAVGEIKIIGAMDGYGNGIPVDKINVTKTNN